MSHFKYEIDERNLRLQLKSNEADFSEEAWHKFETFSSGWRSPAHEDATKRFSFSLNRNVMLPMVFGIIIVLFSLLLFNFINIKNPNAAREARAEVNKPAETVPVPEEKKKEAEPQMKEPVQPLSQTAAVTSGSTNLVTTPVNRVENQPVTSSAPPIAPAKNTALPPATSTAAKTDNSFTNITPNTSAHAYDLPRKQVKKQREAVVSEASAADDEQAPPPVSEPPTQGELK